MSQNIYTIYFNTSNDVIFLGVCKGFSDLEANFDVAVKAVIEHLCQDSASTSEGIATKIYKYDEKINGNADLFLILLKNDISFPQGIAFVKKRYEACVYEKIQFPGKLYNSYTTRYLGRVGVLSQPFTLPENIAAQIDNLNRQLDVNQRIISQQEQTIRRQDSEILRLEHTSFSSNRPYSDRSFEVPNGPAIKRPMVKKIEMASVLKELEEKFSSGMPILKRTRKTTLMLEDLIREIDGLATNSNL